MHPRILAALLGGTHVVAAMCVAAILVFLIAAFVIGKDVAAARGLDKIAALGPLCFAIPPAVFGALHLFGTQFVIGIVPKYMPWPLFWAYFVGVALIATGLSVATKIAVRWSGLLFGIMMFSFDLMMNVRAVAIQPHNRQFWTILFREASFGGAGWVLAASAKHGWPATMKRVLYNVGSTLIACTCLVFSFVQFRHPKTLPGVPLIMEIPAWVPAPVLIDYITSAALLVTGIAILLRKKARIVATCTGGWILLMVLVIYTWVLVTGLASDQIPLQVQGLNYFFDTLLFVGVILSFANGTPQSE